MARPKKTSAVYSRIKLELIAQLREIAFQQKTTISKLIKKAIKYSLTHNILSSESPYVLNSTQKDLLETPPSPPRSKKQEEVSPPRAKPRIADPFYLRELLTNWEVDEEIIQKLADTTVLRLADATIEDLTKLGIPSSIAEEIVELAEDTRRSLSDSM